MPTEEQVANGLTKPLTKDRFLRFRNSLGLIDKNKVLGSFEAEDTIGARGTQGKELNSGNSKDER